MLVDLSCDYCVRRLFLISRVKCSADRSHEATVASRIDREVLTRAEMQLRSLKKNVSTGYTKQEESRLCLKEQRNQRVCVMWSRDDGSVEGLARKRS